MIGPVSYFRGVIQVEVTSADPAAALSAWAKAGIRFWDPKLTGPLTLRVFLFRRDQGKLEKISGRRGDSLEIVFHSGLTRDIGRFLRRPGLVVGLVLLLIMMTVLPKRVWFLRFEGNETIPEAKLIAAAEESGLHFFAKVPDLKSEEIKNQMVNLVPELAWVGVQFEGGIATVSVREREVTPQIRNRTTAANVVAARSGVITSMNVLGGQAVCGVGQAVLEGELLVSGYVDCQTHTQVTQADAEIYAMTQREVSAVLPRLWAGKGEKGDTSLTVSLILGRNRINLCGNSGILPSTYDKITKVKNLTLPGGYVLPVGLCVERGTLWESEAALPPAPEESLTAFGESYIRSQMLAGKILDARTDFWEDGDLFCLDGVYTCNEMIARQRAAEIFEGDTKDD